MRVALSMLTLVPGVSGGSETYARGLAHGLSQRATVDVTALVPTLAPDAGEGLPSTLVRGYRASASVPGRLLAMGLPALRPGLTREAFSGFDVVHYPLTVPVPRARDAARILITLHDLQHRDLPRLFSRGERLFRTVAYDRAARGADLVVVPSVFVRERVTAVLGLSPARVRAIPLGVDHERFTPGAGEREPFLLYPARPWPHKNHARLLEAFALVRRHRPGLRLVLTGGGSERFGSADGVEGRGAVSGEELVSLYRRAACLVFPSLYEGFGLPPLEAMACGTPVAASRAGALPEVCGDDAVLFDPSSADAIARGVLDALDRAGELAARGPAHSARFSWDAAAAAHEDAYRLAQAGARNRG